MRKPKAGKARKLGGECCRSSRMGVEGINAGDFYNGWRTVPTLAMECAVERPLAFGYEKA